MIKSDGFKLAEKDASDFQQAVLDQRDFVESLFDELYRGSHRSRGVTRDAYGPGESFAHELMSQRAQEMGLAVSRDGACNLYMTLPGQDRNAKALVIGSHLDSVPEGGNFDGAAGVVAGLAAVRILQSIGHRPPCDIRVMGIRAEESVWFQYSYIGSRAALGRLPAAVLESKRIDTERSLQDHIADCGGDPGAIRDRQRTIDASNTRAFLEVHIEQAPSLIAMDRPIGLVTAVPGNFRYPGARVTGKYDHVGLAKKYRHDAVIAVSEFVMRLDSTWADWDRLGRGMAFTTGRLHTNPEKHALTKVPGECDFSLDVRAYDEKDLAELSDIVQAAVAEIEAKRGVTFHLGPRTSANVARSDANILKQLEASARDLRIPFAVMGSPASHDAAAFAEAGIPIGMIFVRNANGSHNPEEAMEIADFMDATGVLAHWLWRMLD